MNLNMSGEMLKKVFNYIPAPANKSQLYRIIFSSLLALILLALFIPFRTVKNPWAEKMRSFSPVSHAQTLYNKYGPKMAYDYILYYQSLPNVPANDALNQMKSRLDQERSSLKYKANEIIGIFTGDTHENYAGYIKGAMDYLPVVGDIAGLASHANNLYGHWQKFQNDESVNTFLIALDGIGLIMDICGFVPGAQTVTTPVKKTIQPIYKVWNNVPPQVKTYIFNLFRPTISTITDSDLVKFRASDFNDINALYNRKKDQFDKVIRQTQAAFSQLGPITSLAMKNEQVTCLVLSSSDTPADLEQAIRAANNFNDEDMAILIYGGAEALEAAKRLDAKGQFDPETLRMAMRYGPPGLEAAGHIPASEFRNGAFGPRHVYSWFQIVLLVFYIPYAILAGIKMWLPSLAQKMSGQEVSPCRKN